MINKKNKLMITSKKGKMKKFSYKRVFYQNKGFQDLEGTWTTLIRKPKTIYFQNHYRIINFQTSTRKGPIQHYTTNQKKVL